jgi:hypothetical protein
MVEAILRVIANRGPTSTAHSHSSIATRQLCAKQRYNTATLNPSTNQQAALPSIRYAGHSSTPICLACPYPSSAPLRHEC